MERGDVRVCGVQADVGRVTRVAQGVGVVLEDDFGVDGIVGGSELERARHVELAVYVPVCGDDCRGFRVDVLHRVVKNGRPGA